MAQGYKARGGSNSLNFKTIGGTTEPTSAKKNTIWINTDRNISGVYIDSTQPKNMAEGEVWISNGTSSSVAFNALKRGTIMVYPLSAKQMVSGTLVEKVAKSWQDGKWVDWWDGNFLTPNNEYLQYTGGWVADTQMPPSEESGQSAIKPTVVKRSSEISVYLSDKYQKGSYHTNNKLDLSSINTLSINVKYTSFEYAYIVLFASESLSGNVEDNAAAFTIVNYNGVPESNFKAALDVSTLNGSYYIGLSLCSYNSGGVEVSFDRLYKE
jgi:hypothetical protein